MRAEAVEGEAVERELEEGAVAQAVGEAGAGGPRASLHVEPALPLAELEVVERLEAERARLADAAELLGRVLVVAVGRGRVGRVGHAVEQLLPPRLGFGEPRVELLQLRLQRLRLVDLLRGRRLADRLLPGARLVAARRHLAPCRVGLQQLVEGLRRALAGERRPEGLGIVARRAEVDHATESRATVSTAEQTKREALQAAAPPLLEFAQLLGAGLVLAQDLLHPPASLGPVVCPTGPGTPRSPAPRLPR